jgi:DNA repair protein RecO (recombination protein O)
MNTFKARGIVLREYETGESDKRLALLCKERGRLFVYARGARKHTSALLAATQQGAYADFVVTDGGRFLSLAQAELIEGFHALRGDYERLCCAQYALEICDKAILEQSPCDELLRLLLKTMQHLCKTKIPPEQAARVFLFRFLLYNGLAPEVFDCCVCGAPHANGASLFREEGLLCETCAARPENRKRALRLSASALAALRHILSSETPRAFMFSASAEVLRELADAGRLCWRGHFDTELKSEGMLRAI